MTETLASLAAQTYSNLEVLVINDGSTTPHSVLDLEEQEQLYPQFRFINQDHLGIGAARNRGTFEGNGTYSFPSMPITLHHPIGSNIL